MWRGERRLRQLAPEFAEAAADQAGSQRRLGSFEMITASAGPKAAGARTAGAGESGLSLGRLAGAFIVPQPVPGKGDKAADHIWGQPRRARKMPERRVVVLILPLVSGLDDGFPARQYPAARASDTLLGGWPLVVPQ